MIAVVGSLGLIELAFAGSLDAAGVPPAQRWELVARIGVARRDALEWHTLGLVAFDEADVDLALGRLGEPYRVVLERFFAFLEEAGLREGNPTQPGARRGALFCLRGE